ncbi:MAG: UbiA family prenyltransferase [Candidatus Diapherotrites archaeon]|nr:UbiA family prenyltransferase [Candidatus Diapherotrites archaeon]
MQRLIVWLKFIRPSNGLLAAIATIVGMLVAGKFSVVLAVVAPLAVFLICSAGIVLNDIYDLEIDKINSPERPLPSKTVSLREAWLFTILLFAIGNLLAISINYYCFALAILNSFLEFLYARKLKRIALIGNATDSWFAASSFLFGSLALANINFAVVFIMLIAFFANFGRELFGDIEDIEGDKKLGLKTLPILCGIKISRAVASLLILIAVILSFMPIYLKLFNWYYLPTIIMADIVFVVSLFTTPKKNQLLTKIAMLLALIAFVVGVVL